MPKYVAPKAKVDSVLRKMKPDERAKLVKAYTLVLPNTVILETTAKIPELKDYEVKEKKK